jgi:hypothetical protein
MITHTISFSTTPDGLAAGLAAGDYIKVAMDAVAYDEFAHGVVLSDGTVLSTRMDVLGSGAHEVTAWDGQSENVEDITLVIDDNGKATPRDIVFARKTVSSYVRVYKVEKLTLAEDGTIDVEAVHHPVDENGISEIGKNWTTYQTDANWVIEGNSP